jgi:hypothetical protein
VDQDQRPAGAGLEIADAASANLDMEFANHGGDDTRTDGIKR